MPSVPSEPWPVNLYIFCAITSQLIDCFSLLTANKLFSIANTCKYTFQGNIKYFNAISHVLLIIFSGQLLICLGISAQTLPSVTTAEEGREVREGILCEAREQWGGGKGKEICRHEGTVDRQEESGEKWGCAADVYMRRKQGGGRGWGMIQR